MRKYIIPQIKGTGMKYLLFIVLLVAVLETAGCVSDDKNTVVTPLQTTIAPTIIVTTTVPTTIPIDPVIGVWRSTNSDIITFNQDGTLKSDWAGIVDLGTWRKSGTNQYAYTYNKNIGQLHPYTKGETGESIFPYIYHPDTDTKTQDLQGSIASYWRDINAPLSSSSGQTQSGATHLSGRGDDVQSFSATGSGLRIFSMSHTGSHNFAVVLKDGGGNYVTLLANEIGSYSGKKSERLTSGTYYLDITADGSWTIDISSM
jgi:hypothetical protein